MEAFKRFKELLTIAQIVQPPGWSLLFELICNANEYVVGVVLQQ